MQNIERLSVNDFEKYKKFFSKLGIVSGNDVDDGYRVTINNKDYFLFPFGPFIVIYYLENNIYKSSILEMDRFMNIESFSHGNKQISVNDSGINVIDANHNQQGLYLFKRNEDYNDDLLINEGIISYVQYSASNDLRLEMRYDYNFTDNCIYTAHVRNPFYVSLKENVTKKGLSFLKKSSKFYRLDFDYFDNKFKYNLGAIRERGIGTVVSGNAMSLLGAKFSRFYKVLGQVGDCHVITGFPFSKPYDKDIIMDYLKDLGFNIDVSNKLVSLYNEKDKLLKERQDVIDVYKNSLFFIESSYKLKK